MECSIIYMAFGIWIGLVRVVNLYVRSNGEFHLGLCVWDEQITNYKLLLINTINYECTDPKSFGSNKTDTCPPPSSPLPNMFRFETLFVLNTFPNIPKKKKKNHLVYEMLGILLQFRSIYWVVRKEKVRMQKNLSSSKI